MAIAITWRCYQNLSFGVHFSDFFYGGRSIWWRRGFPHIEGNIEDICHAPVKERNNVCDVRNLQNKTNIGQFIAFLVKQNI